MIFVLFDSLHRICTLSVVLHMFLNHTRSKFVSKLVSDFQYKTNNQDSDHQHSHLGHMKQKVSHPSYSMMLKYSLHKIYIFNVTLLDMNFMLKH